MHGECSINTSLLISKCDFINHTNMVQYVWLILKEQWSGISKFIENHIKCIDKEYFEFFKHQSIFAVVYFSGCGTYSICMCVKVEKVKVVLKNKSAGCTISRGPALFAQGFVW